MTTKRSGGAPPSSKSNPAAAFPQLENWQGPTLDDVTNAGQAYVNGVAAVNQEIANFLQTRLRHDLALGEALARCRTLAEATKAQSDWLKQASDDYTAETQKLFDLGSSLMRGGWAPAKQAETAPKAAASGSVESQAK